MSSEGQRRAQKSDRSSHVWQQQLLGGQNFKSTMEAEISVAGGRRSAIGRDLIGFSKIKYIIWRGWSLSWRILKSVLRSWNLSIEESIREEICGFSSQVERFWPWLATDTLCSCSSCFGSCLMIQKYNNK